MLELERNLLSSRPESMILRVDRTDPSKNVPRGLRRFVSCSSGDGSARPVGMLALLDPSRQRIPEYVEERARIETAAAAVEGVPRRAPVAARGRLPRSVAAYKQFDVLLVNAVMDGLNLVAKEAPLVNAATGQSSSPSTPARPELGPWTVPVDPHDLDGHVRALEDALALPSSNRERLDGIRAHVRRHDLAHWVEAQLADLERASTIRRR